MDLLRESINMDSRSTKAARGLGPQVREAAPAAEQKVISLHGVWPFAILEGKAGMSFICPWW